MQIGCSGIITATCNVTAELSRQVYDDFFSGKKQLHNDKLCDVRSTFDKYNLISGLHTYCAQNDKIYKNILPPLSLLNRNDEEELMNRLKSLELASVNTKPPFLKTLLRNLANCILCRQGWFVIKF